MPVEIIELSNKNITREMFLNVAFLSIAEGGAMGEPGGIVFYTDDGKLYHFNIMCGDVDFETFANAFPVINQCEFGMFGLNSMVPNGWNYVNLGMGNHLIITDRWFDDFDNRIDADSDPAYVYRLWIDVAGRILNPKNKRFVSQKDRIEVFQDTLEWIKSDKVLSASITKAKKNTQIFYEDDYPKFDSSKIISEMIVVTRNRSYQAAMELRKENPDAKIAVMNFANAFHAGGGVKKGAGAQEECLCRCSTLYPLLYRRTLRDTFYKHHLDLNTSKASDSMIYTEGVIICKTDEDYPVRMKPVDWVTVDVMTIAAPDLRSRPNKHAAIVGDDSYMNNTELFGYHVKRAIHMLTVAASKGAEILVLGAFGCGAFQNDPDVVARAYKVALQEFPKVFKKVEFAVYCSPKQQRNYDAFRKVFG